MATNPVWLQYEERIKRVSDYIHDHLDDALNMDMLAEIACLSPYHWHRIYRAIHAETITTTVKRLRMQRAASDLANSNLPLVQIAERAGYSNLQSFNRSFKQYFGKPPGNFRSESAKMTFTLTNKGRTKMYDVKIEKFGPFDIMGVDHKGAYRHIGKAFESVNAIAAARGIRHRDVPSIGIYYDDPDVVPEHDLRAFVAIPSPADFDCKPPFKKQTIPGGEYAVFHVEGPFSNTTACFEYAYGHWLKSSNRELGHHAGFTKYTNPFEPAPEKLRTQIFLPLIERVNT